MDDNSSTVRVALIGCTGLLGDVIVTTLREEPGLTVVASVPALTSDADIAAFDADIVVWNAADEQRIAQWLNGDVPTSRVLAITTDGQEAALWATHPTPSRTRRVVAPISGRDDPRSPDRAVMTTAP